MLDLVLLSWLSAVVPVYS